MLSQKLEKHTPMQIIGIAVIVVLSLLIIVTFAIFGMFRSSDSAPKLFGYRVYVVDNDRMEPRIPKGSAVFVDEDALPSDNKVILCSIDNHLWVLGFVGTETAEDGSVRYLVKYDNATDDKTWGIAQSDIVGVARTYDAAVGAIIRFASSKAGMLTIVIVPCMLVIAYEILMLILSSKNPRRSSSSKKSPTKTADKKHGEPIRRVGGGVGDEDAIPDRENIQAPIDIASDEKYVEKQLKKANNKLSNVVLESADVITDDEISLEPIDIAIEPVLTAPVEKRSVTETVPATQEKPAVSLGELSASRIDELIRLLEEEKKRLEK